MFNEKKLASSESSSKTTYKTFIWSPRSPTLKLLKSILYSAREFCEILAIFRSLKGQ